MLSEVEIKFVLWFVGGLLVILAFIGGLAVKALIKLSTDVSAIKLQFAVLNARHDGQSQEIIELKQRIKKIEDRIFPA